MIYLVKIGNKFEEIPHKPTLEELKQLSIIDKVCDSNSLVDINKYLTKKNLPIIKSSYNFKSNGFDFVFYNAYPLDKPEYIYIVDSENDNIKPIIRNYKINKLWKK